MTKLRFTDAAEIDLEEIGDHIALGSPRSAEKVVSRLREACSRIVELPNRFSRVPRFEERGLRRMVSGSYLIFYRTELDSVVILRIMHGARDYDAILFPDDDDA